jgi:hypothetical protein
LADGCDESWFTCETSFHRFSAVLRRILIETLARQYLDDA